MPRQEASLEGRPQHLRQLAEAMRAIRNDSGLSLKQLAAETHYAESTLSRATNALDLPPWKVVEAFLTHCGVVDLTLWQEAWEDTRKRHEAFQAEGSGAPLRSSLAVPSTPQAAVERLVDERAPTLASLLNRAETPDALVEAIRLLGARSGATSLRQMEQRSQIAKSTIRDWLAGARRPTPERLDGLVQALGATPAEQRQFAQCMERVWSQKRPVLEVHPKATFSPMGTKRGGHCLVVTVTVYDRHLESGLVILANKPQGVLGITAGPTHAVVGKIALLPRVARRAQFTIGIWLDSPIDAMDQVVELDVQMETIDRQWRERLKIKIPASVRSTATAALPGDSYPEPDNKQPVASKYPGPSRNRPVARYLGPERTRPATSPNARTAPLSTRRELPWSDLQTSPPRPAVRLVKEEYPSVSERANPVPPKPSSDYRPKHRGKARGFFGRWVARNQTPDPEDTAAADSSELAPSPTSSPGADLLQWSPTVHRASSQIRTYPNREQSPPSA